MPLRSGAQTHTRETNRGVRIGIRLLVERMDVVEAGVQLSHVGQRLRPHRQLETPGEWPSVRVERDGDECLHCLVEADVFQVFSFRTQVDVGLVYRPGSCDVSSSPSVFVTLLPSPTERRDDKRPLPFPTSSQTLLSVSDHRWVLGGRDGSRRL